MNEWLKTEPPKDGSMFIADVDLPFPVVAAWNGFHGEYVYASLQVNMVDGIYNDFYFETEYDHRTQVKAWMPLPEIKS